MKSKILIVTAFCLCFLLSCDENKKFKVIKSKSKVNRIDSNRRIENIPEENTMNDTSKIDSVKVKQKKKFEIPDYYDYESVYQLLYESFIDSAYNRKTYQKHYKPGTYDSKHLDSIIEEYRKNERN